MLSFVSSVCLKLTIVENKKYLFQSCNNSINVWFILELASLDVKFKQGPIKTDKCQGVTGHKSLNVTILDTIPAQGVHFAS